MEKECEFPDPKKILNSISILLRESANAFGDDTMYIEKIHRESRHVEIQIMADGHGNIVALERT